MLTSAPLIPGQCYDFHQLAQPLVTDEIDALFGDNKSLNPEILGALPFDEIHFYVQHSIPVQLQPPILLRLFLLKAIPWIKKGFWPKCFMISFFRFAQTVIKPWRISPLHIVSSRNQISCICSFLWSLVCPTSMSLE